MDDVTKSRDVWTSDPKGAFLAFIKSSEFEKTSFRRGRGKALSDESICVYSAMFSKFCDYLKEAHLTMFSVEPADIHHFLTQTKTDANGKFVEGAPPELKSGIQFHYLRLLERTFTFLDRYPRPTDNLLFGPLRETYKLNGRHRETAILTQEQIDLFLANLPKSQVKERASRTSAAWKKQRDRALQCLMLGAGLMVAEVIALKMHEISSTVELDGSLRIDLSQDDDELSKHPTFYAHTTFLQKPFVAEVLAWLKERRQMDLPSELVFPNTNGVLLHKATVYRQVKQSFERSGISLARMGGRTLRNTFAVQEILLGNDHEVVQNKLGLFADRSIQIYVDAASEE